MDAFEELYTKYRQDIYRFICKLTDYDPCLSEELLSETFYQAFLSFGRFRGECEIKTWLCQIAKNTYSTYVRKEIKKEHLCDRLKNEVYTADVSEHVENRELLCSIHIILNDCDKKARDIVHYRMYAGLKFREIAKLLDMKETTAKVVFYRTKLFIQAQLKERYGYEV